MHRTSGGSTALGDTSKAGPLGPDVVNAAEWPHFCVKARTGPHFEQISGGPGGRRMAAATTPMGPEWPKMAATWPNAGLGRVQISPQGSLGVQGAQGSLGFP